MTSYLAVKVLHLLTAILGLGQVGALLAISWQASTPAAPIVIRLARIVTVSLLLMLLSGIGLLKMSGWAFAPTWWVRGSFSLMLVIGFSAQRIVKAARSHDRPESSSPAVRHYSLLIAILTGLIVWLMTAKPF
jgi:hypothetical protein